MQLLRSHGIIRNEGDIPRAPEGPWFYQQVDLGFKQRYCTEAERYYAEAISLPMYPGLTAAD
ncbi:MAG: hypothetical protein QNK24_15040 [Desulfuromusa sp.]|nr:hypothetical protein [Desulfuromusa sp.]